MKNFNDMTREEQAAKIAQTVGRLKKAQAIHDALHGGGKRHLATRPQTVVEVRGVVLREGNVVYVSFKGERQKQN